MCAKAAVSGRGEMTHPPISKIFYAPTRNNSDALYTWCRNHQKAFCTCMRVYEITHYLHNHLQLSFSLSSQVLLAVELFCDWTLKSTCFRERKLWAPFSGSHGYWVGEWIFGLWMTFFWCFVFFGVLIFFLGCGCVEKEAGFWVGERKIWWMFGLWILGSLLLFSPLYVKVCLCNIILYVCVY